MKRACVIAALLIPNALVAAPLGPDAKVLRLDSGTTVRLCMDCPQQQLRFQVTVLTDAGKIVATAADVPRVLGVSTSGARIHKLESTFKAAWEPVAGVPRTLVLTIDPPLHVPGTYDVVLNLLPAARPRAPSETVQVIVSAAALQGPDKLFVHRVLRPWGATIRAMPLVVTETGRVSPIRQLGLTSLPFTHRNQPIAAAIVDGSPAGASMPVSVAAGASQGVPYRISEDFPLGLSSGSLRLSAPEMTTALTIPVEVRSELSRFYLALAIIVGLFLSWQVKVVLQRRLQLYRARAAAGTLLEEVEQDRKLFPDVVFRNATKKPVDDLTTAAPLDNREDMDTKRKALDTAWRAARQDLEARRTTFRTQLDTWQKMVSLDWQLPPSFAPVLMQARRAVGSSSTLDETGDVMGATTALDDADAQAARALRETGRKWQQASRRFFDELIDARAGVSAAILQRLKTKSDGWRTSFPEISPAPMEEGAVVQQLLRQITGEYVTARDHLAELARLLQREFASVAADLLDNDTAPELVASIKERLTALEGTLSKAADHPEIPIDSLPHDLEALQEAWTAAFEAATSKQPQDVAECVKRRDFRGAAELLGGAGVLDAAGPSAAAGERFKAGLALAPVATGGALVRGELPAASPYAALVHASEEQIKQTKLLQTLIVGGLFFVWAMSTSSAAFDGTVRGLFTALFSAFSLDVGVDTLLARVKGTVFS